MGDLNLSGGGRERGDRIMSAGSEWVAAKHPPHGHQPTPQEPKALDRFDSVIRAGRMEPAAALEEGRQECLVDPDQPQTARSRQRHSAGHTGIRVHADGSFVVERLPQAGVVRVTLARAQARMSLRRAYEYSRHGLPVVMMRSVPGGREVANRINSRMRRRKVFRSTAFPKRLETMKPNRNPSPGCRRT